MKGSVPLTAILGELLKDLSTQEMINDCERRIMSC
jgi:hypothetical protein